MSKRYSGKSNKDRNFMKKAKLTLKEKRKIKREKKKNKNWKKFNEKCATTMSRINLTKKFKEMLVCVGAFCCQVPQTPKKLSFKHF